MKSRYLLVHRVLSTFIIGTALVAQSVAQESATAKPVDAGSTATDAEHAADADGWISLFDGSMKGWKASENKESWVIDDGCFLCKGERSHLFYVGDKGPFRNFEFKCKVKTLPGSNAGIYFHTKYQEKGWPKFGYECQVNQTHGDPKKSSSLYDVKNVADPGVKDEVWYTQHIIVTGRKIVLKINDKVMVEYTEPENKEAHSKDFERRLISEGGTIAFQAHDPKSRAYFKDIMIKKLP